MISPQAHVHPEASVGLNTTIEPFAFIDKDVNIGENCWIGPNACIFEGARIGDGCRIFPGAQISCEPQDMKYNGEKTTTIIGDNTDIREFVTLSRGTGDRMQTRIGSNCLLMSYVHIAHDCIVKNHAIISNAVQVAGHATIGEHTVIGGTAAVRQFVNIGAHVMIAGGSLVRKDIPPFVFAAREPLSYNGINAIGLKRRGFTTNQLNELQEIYRIIYLSDLNITKAIAKINEEYKESDFKDTIVNFIQESERGIMKGMD
ncbi:MAG: acyl-ACP--UDP-N-acetylglucosamine O-acyltransferase [Cyclobacteriaceae bacterium]